ncbi:MAG: HD family hydrolase [Candidatus Bathyarchaeia archaeon]
MSSRLLTAISSLKRTPRSGWLTHGVSLQDVESVADHTFSTCALSLILTDFELKRGVRVNVERVLRMATLHDLAEAFTFDISKSYLAYLGKRGEVIKDEIEASAWKHLVKGIKSLQISNNYLMVHKEYLENKTIEAKIVHAADSLDILLQIVDLRRRGNQQSCLKNLWNTTIKRLRTSSIPSVSTVLKMIVEEARELER